jgi:hypothetical protein
MPLDLFNNVLLEDLALKPLESILQAFALVNLNFSRWNSPLLPAGMDSSA